MTPGEQDLTTKIGLRLRSVRNSQKLSLEALSDRTDGLLCKSRIGNCEQGTRHLGIEEARMLAKALAPNPGWIHLNQ